MSDSKPTMTEEQAEQEALAWYHERYDGREPSAALLDVLIWITIKQAETAEAAS